MKKLLSWLLVLGVCLSTLCGIPFHSASGATYYNGDNAIAWSQKEGPWAWDYYGSGSVYDTACGILSTTNAINYLTGAFNTEAKANAFIDDWATYAHNIGGYNPGSSSSGGYRYILFGTDISNPPPLAARYGGTYNFDMPITWTENWNSGNYYNGYGYNNIYVNTQTALKNYLAGDAVAIAHVPGHFICLADYNPATDSFLVLDSYTYWTRGGLDVFWKTADQLSVNGSALTVGGYCVLRSTVNNTQTAEPTKPDYVYPYDIDDNNKMLYDGENLGPVTVNFGAKKHLANGKNGKALQMQCLTPTTDVIGGMAMVELTDTANLTAYPYITMDVFLSKSMSGSHGLQVNFISGDNTEDGYNKMITINNISAGWHTFAIDRSEVPNINSADWSKIKKIRFSWWNYAEYSATDQNFLIDNVKAKKIGYPKASTPGTLMLYDGDSTDGLIGNYDTSLSLVSGRNSGKSLKMDCTKPTTTNDVGGMMRYSFIKTTDLTSYDKFYFDIYVPKNYKGAEQYMQVNFATSGQDGFNAMVKIGNFIPGWTTVELEKSGINKVVDSADWSKINNIRFTWYNKARTDVATYFQIDNFKAVNTSEVSLVSYPYVNGSNELVLYDGEYASVVTPHYNTSVSCDVQGKNGHALKIACNNPAGNNGVIGGMSIVSMTKTGNVTDYPYISFQLYVAQDMVGSHGLQVNFCTASEDGYNYMVNISDLPAGWYGVTLEKDTIGKASATADWSRIKNIRFSWWNYAGSTTPATFYIDSLRGCKTGTVSVPADTKITYPYQLGDGVLMLHDGESKDGLTLNYSTEAALVDGKIGNALKMHCKAPSANQNEGGMLRYSFFKTTDLSSYDKFYLDLYVPSGQIQGGSHRMQINFATEGQDGYNCMVNIGTLSAGWNTIKIDRAGIGQAVASADWTKINNIRFTWYNYSRITQDTAFMIDNFRAINTTLAPVQSYPYMVGNELILHDGQDVSNFKDNYGATTSVGSGQDGSAFQLTCNNPENFLDTKIGGMTLFTLDKTADLSGYDTISYELYISRDFGANESAQFGVNFCTDGEDGYNTVKVLKGLKAGWYTITLTRANLSLASGQTDDWSKINAIRFTWHNFAQVSTDTYFLVDNVKAYNSVVLSNIFVSSYPMKTTYFLGEDFEATGLGVKAMYSDGKEEVLSSGYTLSGFDSTTAGTKTVTVAYNGKTTTFTVAVKEPEPVELVITSMPTKTEYWVGEALRTAGIALKLVYDDGSEKAVSSYVVSDYDFSTPGTKEMEVSYGNLSTTFNVTVKEITLTGIAVKTNPIKTTYWVGETLDATGLMLTVTYSNGSTSTVSNGFTFSGFDSTTAGTKTVTVTYNGQIATFDVAVNAVTVTSIAVETMPTKITYWTGETFNPAGLTIRVTYSNGTSQVVTTGFSTSGFLGSTTAGSKTVNVNYLGVTTSFEVTVVQPTVTGIQVSSLPNTIYWVGEDLDLTDLAIRVNYSDGSYQTMDTGFTVSGFDSATAGQQTLTVYYNGFTATYVVTVKEVAVTGILVKNQPAKTVYWVGETLDTAGLTVQVNYSDGTSQTMTFGFDVSGFSSTVAGQKLVTVAYGGQTATFTVTVRQPVATDIAIETLPAKTTYWVDGTFVENGLTLRVNYNDGSYKIVDTGFTVSEFDLSTAGTKTVTVTYLGFTATFMVTVNEPTITGIAVETPGKTQYFVGESADYDWLTIRATYSNGTSKVVEAGFSIGGFDSTTAGDKTLTVTYQGHKTTYQVTVNELTVTDIGVETLPGQLNYWVGDGFNTNGLALRVNYNDGSYKIVDDGFVVSGFDATTAGEQTITVTYGAFTATYTVTVSEIVVTDVAVETLPNKTVYWTGERLDTTGLTLKVTYSNGTTIVVDSDFTTNGFVSSTLPGEKNVRVTYQGFNTSFSVQVNQPTPIGIALETAPTHTEYWVGDAFDSTGLSLKVNYSDGSQQVVDSGYEITGFDPSVVGEQSVRVYFGDYYVTVKVNVLAVTVTQVAIVTPPNKLTYWVGESFVTEGLTVKVTYSNGAAEVISTGFAVTGFDGNQPGEQTITVTFEEQTTTFAVTVKEVVVTDIAMETKPLKEVYTVGEALATDGLTVQVTYSDGTKAVIATGFDLSGYDATVAGEQTVTVTYQGVTTSFVVTVEQLKKQQLMGDANFDDKVDAADALDVLKCAVGKIKFTTQQKLVCDMNGDDTIDAADALEILKTAVGKIPPVYITVA